MTYIAESILELIKQEIPDGVHTYTCSKNSISLNFQIINYTDDVVFSVSPVLGNTTADSQMLILKFHKSLKIDAGVTLTPQVRKKGFTIFCMGKLTNNGTISMTARGASAAGQNLYLYKDEFIPAVGASGGASIKITGQGQTSNGNPGKNGTGRQTGGGGTGSLRNWYYSATVGRGGIGTSYSGGTGSGASNSDGSYGGTSVSANGSDTGAAGSNGDVKAGNASGFGPTSLGGTGNPSGGYAYYRYAPANVVTRTGTGGLLILFVKTLENNGIISSNGVSPSTASKGNSQAYICTGGASGGGSVNIFYQDLIKDGTLSAIGGPSLGLDLYGGAGGNGTVTLTKIELKLFSSQIYSDIKENILNNDLVNKAVSFFE